MIKKAYTVAIPNLPLIPNKKVLAFLKWIGTLEGHIGIHPHYPDGTLILFDTENHAKVARNRIKAYKGFKGTVGDNICEVEYDDMHGRALRLFAETHSVIESNNGGK